MHTKVYRDFSLSRDKYLISVQLKDSAKPEFDIEFHTNEDRNKALRKLRAVFIPNAAESNLTRDFEISNTAVRLKDLTGLIAKYASVNIHHKVTQSANTEIPKELKDTPASIDRLRSKLSRRGIHPRRRK